MIYEYGKKSFKKRIDKIHLKKRPNSSCQIGSSNSSTNKIYGEGRKRKYLNNSYLSQLNNSCVYNTSILPSKFKSTNISESNASTMSLKNKNKNKGKSLLYDDSIKLKTKINKLKKELALTKSDIHKKEDEILKREKAIKKAKNKLKENNSYDQLKEQNTIIKLKDNYQSLKEKMSKQIEENNKLQNEIKIINLNDLQRENNINLHILRQKIKDYNNKLLSNLEYNNELQSLNVYKKLYLYNHSYIEKIQKKILEKSKKIDLMKENLQLMKDKLGQIEENKRRIISYNESIKKQNEKLLIDKKKREDYILKKPVIMGIINQYEEKTKNIEDKNKSSEIIIHNMALERKEITQKIKEAETCKPINYKKMIVLQNNPNENINQKILLLQSLIKESKDRQNQFIEIFWYYDDYVKQKENYEIIDNEAKLIENNMNNNNNDDINYQPQEEFIIHKMSYDNNSNNNNNVINTDDNKNYEEENINEKGINKYDNSPPFINSYSGTKNKNNENYENKNVNEEIFREKEEEKEGKEEKEEKENKDEKDISYKKLNKENESKMIKDMNDFEESNQNIENKKVEKEDEDNNMNDSIERNELKKLENKENNINIDNKRDIYNSNINENQNEKEEQEEKKEIKEKTEIKQMEKKGKNVKEKIDNKKKNENKYKSFKLMLSIMFFIKKIGKEKIENILSVYKTEEDSKEKDDKYNYILNLSKNILNLIDNNNENDIKLFKKILIYLLEEKYQNNKDKFLNGLIIDFIEKNKLPFGQSEDEEDQLFGKLIKAYSSKGNILTEKLKKDNKQFISYKNLKKYFKEEKLYIKNNKESSELFKFYIYILKKNNSFSDEKISIFDFVVEDIINLFNGIQSIANDKRIISNDNENPEDDGGIMVHEEEFRKIITKFIEDLNKLLEEKKLELNSFIGDENINIMEKDGKEIEVINIYKFIEILKENGYAINDNLINSCIFAKYQIDENLEDIDINLINNDLKLIK